jgi:protein dithiol:quinone oxidoreductase
LLENPRLNPMLESRLPWWQQRRMLNLSGFLWCAALMAYALYVQYGLHEEPCPLCVLQRVAVIGTGFGFLLAWAINPRAGVVRGMILAVIVLSALAGIGIAARHIYVINAPAGAVAECGASLDYMMDVLPLHQVLAKVLSGSGECAKVTWRFLGLSMPFWVLVNLLGLAALGLFANWRKR